MCWPSPVFSRCSQRGEDGVAGVEAGEDVGQRHADLLRAGALLAVGAAGDAHQAAHALDQEVVAGARGIGAVLAEAGDRAVDERGLSAQAGVVEAVGLEAADLEVLQHHVGPRRQFAHDGLAFGRVMSTVSERLLRLVHRK
jgi:hypothetical protein